MSPPFLALPLSLRSRAISHCALNTFLLLREYRSASMLYGTGVELLSEQRNANRQPIRDAGYAPTFATVREVGVGVSVSSVGGLAANLESSLPPLPTETF